MGYLEDVEALRGSRRIPPAGGDEPPTPKRPAKGKEKEGGRGASRLQAGGAAAGDASGW
jgi:hypothetical protein